MFVHGLGRRHAYEASGVGRSGLAAHPDLEMQHRTEPDGGKHTMFRLSLYVLGISAFVAAWAAYRNQLKARPMPVGKAATMLQKAWADNHTEA
jgi:hypothetical protein